MKHPPGVVPRFAKGPWEPWFAWYPVRLGTDLGRAIGGGPIKWAFLRRVRRRWAAGPTGIPGYVDYDELDVPAFVGSD